MIGASFSVGVEASSSPDPEDSSRACSSIADISMTEAGYVLVPTVLRVLGAVGNV